MIGLIVLAIGGAWLLISMASARFLASKFKPPLVAALVAVLSFVAIATLPFADEIVGRRQFANLCKKEAVVWMAPNSATVTAAKNVGGFSERAGLVFPVQQQSIRYTNLSNGEVFYSVTAFHTPGGVLMRAGLGLGHSRSCWPERWGGRALGIDIDAMVKRGEQLEFLEQFGSELRAIRSSTTASARWVRTVPEPRPLVGASREAVLNAFGAPDTCQPEAKESCLKSRSWSYQFFRIPAGSTGLTPQLHIQFGGNEEVESSKWSFSK